MRRLTNIDIGVLFQRSVLNIAVMCAIKMTRNTPMCAPSPSLAWMLSHCHCHLNICCMQSKKHICLIFLPSPSSPLTPSPNPRPVRNSETKFSIGSILQMGKLNPEEIQCLVKARRLGRAVAHPRPRAWAPAPGTTFSSGCHREVGDSHLVRRQKWTHRKVAELGVTELWTNWPQLRAQPAAASSFPGNAREHSSQESFSSLPSWPLPAHWSADAGSHVVRRCAVLTFICCPARPFPL